MGRNTGRGRRRKRLKTVKIPIKDWVFVDQYAGNNLTLYEAMHEIISDYRELQTELGEDNNLEDYEKQIASKR